MRVHVIFREGNPEHILARLANALVERAGWSAGSAPDPTADVNYYFPYLEVDRNWHDTKTAAWFTHRDDPHPGKVTKWTLAAADVDLRLTSARIYLPELETFGVSALVTPPVDCAAFDIKTRARRQKPVVGVSGFVYPGGRKGDALVKRLAHSPLAERLTLKASGRGWDVPTRYYPAKDLPSFYQSLDVYLCPSTIEGIPMPPLEALACGVKVVIPRYVGLLDDLPDLPGIVRYTAGDYADMERALAVAVQIDADPAALRAAVETSYTVEAWADTHAQVFEQLVTPTMVGVDLPDWHGHSGVYYVAFGDPARTCAQRAITSWHTHMGDLPCAMASDTPIGGEDIFIKTHDADVGARTAKIRIYDNAPADWHYVLYLDADTEVVADVSFLFETLADGWELVICKNPSKYHVIREMVRPDNADECQLTYDLLGSEELLQLNGGVFAFRRCDRVQRFFQRWHEEWNMWGKRDQAALLRALYAEPLRVYVLGNEWNTVVRYDPPERTAGILHYPTTARRWDGPLFERLDSEQAWKRVTK